MRKLLVLFGLLFLLASAHAVLQNGQMKIFAVTSEGTALSADLILETEPGTGKIWSSVGPLVGTTTQNAERVALKIAGSYSTEVNNYDYKFTIGSDASVVEGPSAGAAMALLAVSMLKDNELPPHVSVTGTVDESGNVGPVGGVFAKSEEAARTGIKLFMIPKGEARQTVKLNNGVQSINLLEYGPEKWGLVVVEVADIDEALKYAYSDVEQLDVNTEAGEAAPEFIPKPISHSAGLLPMKNITGKYLSEAKVLVSQARVSLSTTLLEDASLIAALLDILNSADRTLQDAELLYDQNYLYSAANFAFLAKVNAGLVKDISDNPSLLNADSSAFDSQMNALKGDVRSLRSELSKSIPIDFLEYHIAAKQRLTYAENTLDELMATQTVVVNGEPPENLALERLRDYEFAYAWYSVAKDFHVVSIDSEKRVKPNNAFSKAPDQYIITAENGLAVLVEDDVEDIERRLEAAKSEKRSRWYAASVFDAASAISLINGSIAAKDADLNQLYSILREKIAAVDANILRSEREYVWARLYLDHAKYYLGAADFYYSQNLGASTVSSLRSGISLIMLAENLLIVSDDLYGYYDAISPQEYLGAERAAPPAQAPGATPATQAQYLFTFVVVFSLVAVLIILIIGRTVLRESGKPHLHTIPAEISYVERLKQTAQNACSKGRITKEAYEQKIAGYDAVIRELNELRKAGASHVLELDRVKVELAGYKVRLKELKKHYNDGMLSEAEYKSTMSEYAQKIKELTRRSSVERLGVTTGSKKLDYIAEEIESVKKTGRLRRAPGKEHPAGKAGAVQKGKEGGSP